MLKVFFCSSSVRIMNATWVFINKMRSNLDICSVTTVDLFLTAPMDMFCSRTKTQNLKI